MLKKVINIDKAETHSSTFNSFKCQKCGGFFKPFNHYCEDCGTERPYTYSNKLTLSPYKGIHNES